MLTAPSVPFGRYELVHCLGQGRLGEVHLARLRGEAGFEKLYVLKTLVAEPDSDPQLLQRFQHEARVLVHLQHPNIAQVYELSQAEGTAFMAMEYVPGVELGQLLARARQLGAVVPIALALYVAQRVAEALEHAHRKAGEDGKPLDIVHRAISPDTVRVSFDGEVKVMDFSLARSTAALASTRRAQVLGRLGYMSPEQARAEKVDARSDIYSCGVVLWEMLAGRRLFEEAPYGELLAGMAHPVIPSLHLLRPDISPSLEEVLQRALAPSVHERYARAEELVQALNEERAREGARVGDAEVRAWVRTVCPRELADQGALIASLSSGETGVFRPAAPALVEAPTQMSQGGVPTVVMGPRAVAARKGSTSRLTMGALGLVLAGVVGTAVMTFVSGDEPRKPSIEEEKREGTDVPPPVEGGQAGSTGTLARDGAGGSQPGQGQEPHAVGAPPVRNPGTDDAGVQYAAGPDAGTPDAGMGALVVRGMKGADEGEDPPLDDALVDSPDAGSYSLVRVKSVHAVAVSQGQYLVRAGSDQGVGMSTRFLLVGPPDPDGRRPLYTRASVKTLLGVNRARLRPDRNPPKGTALFAYFKPEPKPQAPAPPPPSPPLQAWAQLHGAQQAITFANRGGQVWTKCLLRLKDRKYALPRVEAGAQQQLPLAHFDLAPPREDLQGAMEVSCREGSTRLRLAGR